MPEGVDVKEPAKNGQFESRSLELQRKYGLQDAIPNFPNVIAKGKDLVDQYRLPESFFADDINMALILGGSQKLVESTDPYYQQRVENFLKRLVGPVAAPGTVPEIEIWGHELTGISSEELLEYSFSKIDDNATLDFMDRHADEIERVREIWNDKGKELELQVIVVDDTKPEFRKHAGGTGFIHNHDDTHEGRVVEMVFLKGETDGDDRFFRHELYHLQDFTYFRRGHSNTVLENLDELHTEYSAANYAADNSQDPFTNAAYFDLKQFWDRMSFTGNLDFKLLGDRTQLVDTLTKQFGFTGLVDFALLASHGGGQATYFETFYRSPFRPILSMLIGQEKINIRNHKEEDLGLDSVVGQLKDLAELSTPGDDPLDRYSSIYDLIPTAEGKIYASRVTGDYESYSKRLANTHGKDLVRSYAKALGIIDLFFSGEITISDSELRTLTDAVSAIPIRRKKGDHATDRVNYDVNRLRDTKEEVSEEDIRYVVENQWHGLVYDMGEVDFQFSLSSSRTRDILFNPFLKELDALAEYVTQSENPKYPEYLANGIYGFNLPWELREFSADYLSDKYPVLKAAIDERRSKYNPTQARARHL